jgi:hypothetical protein
LSSYKCGAGGWGGDLDIPHEAYLFNLSLLAITFTAVSALVMLLRQTMGGRLSPFDIYLMTSFVSLGFTQALMSVLPSLVALYAPSPRVLWLIASGGAAIIHAGVVASIIRLRRMASKEPMSCSVKLGFTTQIFAACLLVINALIMPWDGLPLYATALTLSVGAVMWSFVRRIASLFGERPGEDWDPRRG